MNVQAKKKVPALRFPGFEGEWEARRMEKVIKRIVKPVEVVKDQQYQEIGIRSHGKGLFYKKPVTGEILGTKRVFWIQKDVFIVNIVFAWEQAVAKTTIKEVGMIASHRFPMYRPLTNISSLDYILWFFLTRKGKVLLELASPGGAGRNKTLGQKEFEKLKIPLPSLPEQQKIAAFLTSIDTRIQQLTRKVDLLEQYKKGVMQQIFAQEIRFKDDQGRDFPAWEEKRLGDVAARVLQKNKDSAVTFVLTNSATQGIISQQDYFEKDIANQENLGGYYVVQQDDFIYNPRISASAPVGPIKRNKLTTGVMSPLYTVFRFKKYNLDFFEHFFETAQWHSYMRSIANYGARHDRMNITNADFLKMPVPIPVPKEQKKIADFLTVIDQKITLTKNQLKHMQRFKKGLLQQLFV